MAQSIATTKGQWQTFFREPKIREDEDKQYSETFHTNRMTFNVLHELTKEGLSDIGITVLGEIKKFFKESKSEFK